MDVDNNSTIDFKKKPRILENTSRANDTEQVPGFVQKVKGDESLVGCLLGSWVVQEPRHNFYHLFSAGVLTVLQILPKNFSDSGRGLTVSLGTFAFATFLH